MDVHQRIAGLFLAMLSLFGWVTAAVLAAALLSFGPGAHEPQLFWPWLFTLPIGLLIVGVALLWAFGALHAGVSLYRGRRSRALVPVAAIALLGFPLGTVAGVYALWSVWREQAQKLPPDWRHIASDQRVAQRSA